MYIWGYQTPVFIPICTIGSKKTSFLVKFFYFQGTNVHLGLPNSSFYPIGSKKTSFLVTKLHFFRLGKKKNIFSEIFPFLGNKCTFGGTKLQFLSPSGQKFKNFIFSEIFPSGLGNKLYIWGYQTPIFIPNFYDLVTKTVHFQWYHFSSFYSHRVKKKLYYLVVNFSIFRELNVHLGVLPNSSFYPNRVKKTSFLVKFLHFQGKNLHLWVPNSQSGQKKLLSPIWTIGSKKN